MVCRLAAYTRMRPPCYLGRMRATLWARVDSVCRSGMSHASAPFNPFRAVLLYIQTDSMSEASARRRRAWLQWICVAGVRRERPRHGSPAELYGPSRLLMEALGRSFCTARIPKSVRDAQLAQLALLVYTAV
eukprot:5412310-Prymnesium_polylepis.1